MKERPPMGFARVRLQGLLPLLISFSLMSVAGWAAADGHDKGKAGQEQGKTYARVTDASQYVGSETCKTCHEDMPAKDFYKNY